MSAGVAKGRWHYDVTASAHPITARWDSADLNRGPSVPNARGSTKLPYCPVNGSDVLSDRALVKKVAQAILTHSMETLESCGCISCHDALTPRSPTRGNIYILDCHSTLYMGNIRPTYIKKITHELIAKRGYAFGTDFDENKKSVSEHTDITSKTIRNRVAGYVTRRNVIAQRTKVL